MSAARKFAPVTSEADLIRQISEVIMQITGVQLGEKQYSLVQGRLAKRMRELRLSTPAEYARYLVENEAVETGVLTSLLTTHHTYFFREFSHFEFLLKETLPKLIRSHQAKGLDTIRIWSAACSRGQEVYSLAMFLKHHLPQLAPQMKFEILGSDVDEESVGIAKNGVYQWSEIKAVPAVYLQGNWMRGTGEIATFVRVKDDLRKHCRFQPINLLEIFKSLPPGPQPKFDIIFCRNVFIYFTHEHIKAITNDFLKLLNPDGQLFIGLSESLNGLDLPVDWVGPSVYASKGHKPAKTSASPVAEKVASTQELRKPGQVITPPAAVWTAPKKLRVLCVDDSSTVLMLLKKILTPEKGFEIVGTAGDGEEAAKKARELKPDIMTLDIHMPTLTGVGYLEKHHASCRVPVVMVSSVSREDSQLAFRALELGASDYIEKPSLQNLVQIEEELLFKLRAAFEASALSAANKPRLDVDSSFKRSMSTIDPKGKMRVIVAGFGARESVLTFLKELRGSQPPVLVLFEGGGELFRDWVAKIAPRVSGSRKDEPKSGKDLAANSVWFMDAKQGFEFFRKEAQNATVSVLAIGPVSKQMTKSLVALKGAQLILEDRGAQIPSELATRANETVPLTSFLYESDRFFTSGGGGK